MSRDWWIIGGAFSLLPLNVLHDNSKPRYLPHLGNPAILQMGLTPLRERLWIETDNDLGLYHRHKRLQRARWGDRVFRATAASLPAQRELAAALLAHLCSGQGEHFRVEGDDLHCDFAAIRTPVQSDEPLWNCSLWIADDLAIMEEAADGYRLTAASLCCPSHWRLEEKFGRPLREIHDPVPRFHQELTPRIERFFARLKPQHPVVRCNWSLQAGDGLSRRPEEQTAIRADSPLYYRTERQSLVRLPRSGAIAFTIRVYLHPLESLAAVEGALPALFAAIDHMPPELRAYKGLDRLQPVLAAHRRAG